MITDPSCCCPVITSSYTPSILAVNNFFFRSPIRLGETLLAATSELHEFKTVPHLSRAARTDDLFLMSAIIGKLGGSFSARGAVHMYN